MTTEQRAYDFFFATTEAIIATRSNPAIALEVMRQFSMAVALLRSGHPPSSEWTNTMAGWVHTGNPEIDDLVIKVLDLYLEFRLTIQNK